VLAACADAGAGKLGGSLIARTGQPAVLGSSPRHRARNLDSLASTCSSRSATSRSRSARADRRHFLLFGWGSRPTSARCWRLGPRRSSGGAGRHRADGARLLLLGVVFPSHNPLTHWFVGATLCATSVASRRGCSAISSAPNSTEGRIIPGCGGDRRRARADRARRGRGNHHRRDSGAAFQIGSVLWIVGKSLIFLWRGDRRPVAVEARLPPGRPLQARGCCSPPRRVLLRARLCRRLVGLAPIVGAFAAGSSSTRSTIATSRRAITATAESTSCWSLNTILVPSSSC